MTERFRSFDVKTEEQLQAANLMLDSAPVAAYWTRKDGSFAWVNQCACDMLGYTREELLDLTIHVIDKEADRDFWSRYWDAVDNQEISLLERWHTRRDGSVIPVEVTVRLLEYRSEAVHLAFVRDLTEQKQADDLRKGHAQFMTALFKDSPMPQIIIDPDNMQIIDANTAAEIFYGHEQLRGLCISTISTLTPDEIKRQMRAAQLHKRTFFRFRHRLASGSIRDVHVYSGPIKHEGRILLHSNIEDMTPLYAFQRELEAYRDQLERLPIGVYRATPGPSGVIISVNQRCVKYWRSTPGQTLSADAPATSTRHRRRESSSAP